MTQINDNVCIVKQTHNELKNGCSGCLFWDDSCQLKRENCYTLPGFVYKVNVMKLRREKIEKIREKYVTATL